MAIHPPLYSPLTLDILILSLSLREAILEAFFPVFHCTAVVALIILTDQNAYFHDHCDFGEEQELHRARPTD